MDFSISEYFYDPSGPSGRRCGYCKSTDTNQSHGMWTHRLTVDDYQDMIDRGWRRSGKYCYKSVMSSTCCPLYTISCSATKFRISKSQKGCANVMTKYLTSGERPGGQQRGPAAAVVAEELEKLGKYNVSEQKKETVKPGEGADPSKPKCKKAKVLRKERKARKIAEASSIASAKVESPTGTNTEDKPKKCSDSCGMSEGACSSTPEFLQIGKDGKKPVELFLKVPESAAKPLAHQLDVRLIQSSPPSEEFNATFKESYSLFKKYQMSVHKKKEEDCQESGFRRFLCDSPLIPKKGKKNWPCNYGSYHQHYRIDGKLIAVGVIDILPKCISSVYVFMDMDFSFLSLGVYSALREIEMARKLHLGDPANFKYYYMGYYIHTCQKMTYKGKYHPSYLLCPETYVFEPIESCLPKLEKTKYSRLCETDQPAENVLSWLGDARVLFKQTIYLYQSLAAKNAKVRREEEKMKEYVKLVGPKVCRRMVLYLES